MRMKKDMFSEPMTASEFKKSMLMQDDDFDLNDILETYPDFDGKIIFNDETCEEKI